MLVILSIITECLYNLLFTVYSLETKTFFYEYLLHWDCKHHINNNVGGYFIGSVIVSI